MSLRLLILAMALPCTGYALGLGEIHVESALRRPLNAYIDILDASGDDLANIEASIANQEIFQRYGLDRPSFLSSATLTVGRDKLKRPIVVIRSTDASMEPMVSFLVALRSPEGVVVREYVVLFDPPGLTPTQNDAPTNVLPDAQSRSTSPIAEAPVTAATVNASQITAEQLAIGQLVTPQLVTPQAVAPINPNARMHRIGRHDTLQRIVARAGAHSRSERHRMMVAVYRANPRAFRNNMNLLRVGAVLHLPDAAELSDISAQDAARELAAQKAALKTVKHDAPPGMQTVVPAELSPAVRIKGAAEPDDTVELTEKVASLEKALGKVREELDRPLPALSAAPVAVAAASSPDLHAQGSDSGQSKLTGGFGTLWVLATTSLAFALAVAAWFQRRRRRSIDSAESISTEDDQRIIEDLKANASQRDSPYADPHRATAVAATDKLVGANAPRTPLFASKVAGAHSTITPHTESVYAMSAASGHQAGDTTIALTVPDSKYEETVELTFANFNPEATINTMHVTIPDSLNDQARSVERRKNPADVLRQALEREPARSDLRLKLLELYYVAAAQNRKAFLDIAHQLSKNINMTSPQEWSQIMDMGRKIAPDEPLFAEGNDDQAVA